MTTSYGKTAAISVLTPVGGFRKGWNLVQGCGMRHTLVYQFETELVAKAVESAWTEIDSDHDEVYITFGEIPGMWKNKNSRLRLSYGFNADGQYAFDKALICAFDTLSKTAISLLGQYSTHAEKDKLNISVLYNDEMRNKLMNAIKDQTMFHEDGVMGEYEWTERVENSDCHLTTRTPDCERNGGFSDIAGFDELKEKLQDEVIWPLNHKSLVTKYRITMPNGMLLYGPPGCGKSFFAKKFAEESGFNFMFVSPSEIGGIFIHESQKKLAELFEEATRKAPCIICFDEIDAMVPRRSSTPGIEYQNTEVNEFLVRMNNCGEKGIFVIGTTNAKELIDPAALRAGRLDYHVEIPLPCREQRVRLFETSMKGRPSLTIDWNRLAEASEGLTAADIAFIVNRSALASAKKGIEISTEILLKFTVEKVDEHTGNDIIEGTETEPVEGPFPVLSQPKKRTIMS